MTDQLERLYAQFDRADQKSKRMLGEYLYDKPARWIPRQEIVKQLNIDESGVSRHIDALHEEGFITSKYDGDQRYVQWNGRGKGGVEYWLRQAVPSQLWTVGSELRPLLTLDFLGGAYVPTLLFSGLVLVGFTTAVLAVIISYLPLRTVFDVTVIELVILTGLVTILASVLFLLIPVSKILELGVEKAWSWGVSLTTKNKRGN